MHEWISSSDGKAAGMGTANGVPQSDAPGVKTQVVDHKGQIPERSRTFSNVDKAALDSHMVVGRPTGRWMPGTNDCNTWAAGVVGLSTPHALLGIDPTNMNAPIVLQENIVEYADGSVHTAGGK